MGFIALGGGCTAGGSGCTSADGGSIFLPRGFGIHVCSSSTAEKTGYIGSHRDRVTAVARDPRHPTQVYTSSLDGTIKLWDASDGELVSTITVGEPVHSLADFRVSFTWTLRGYQTASFTVGRSRLALTYQTAANAIADHTMQVSPNASQFLYLSCHKSGAKSGKVRRADVTSMKLAQDIFKVSAAPALEASSTGSLVATTNRNTLLLWRTSTTLNDALPLHHTKKLTCCALGPSGDTVAAGDITGRILLWRGIDSALLQPRSSTEALTMLTTMHWHSAAVNCITFSADGSYMLSGGSEAVLVIWQIHSGKRTYLPRLGSALLSIRSTPDPSSYLVTQADNSARLINASAMKVECSVYGALPPPRPAADVRGAVGATPALHPRSGHLVLPAENCTLQFYDAVHDKHVACLQVAPRNPVSWSSLREDTGADESMKPAEEPQITSFSFSREGDWLVTAELRPYLGQDNSTDCSLKFWEQSGRQAGAMQSYVLSTRADAPHAARVSCVAYHPSKHLVVSGSADGQFKIWARQKMAATPGHSSQWGWRCRSSATLAQPGLARQDAAIQSAAFSRDGSLLALASGDKVSIWEPDSNSLVSYLPKPSGVGKTSYTQLCFLCGMPYVVGISNGADASIVVWNLLTLSVWWSYKLEVSQLAADPNSGRFAVALPALEVAADDHSSSPRCAHVLLFDGESCKPVAAWRLLKTHATSLMFARPGSELASKYATVGGASPLLVVTDAHQFTVLAPELPSQSAPRQDSIDSSAKSSGNLDNESALEAVFGKTQTQSPGSEAGDTSGGLRAALPSEWMHLLDTPSHALPPIAELCPMLLEKMVNPSSTL